MLKFPDSRNQLHNDSYETLASEVSFLCSPAFDDFLSIIGDKVRLKGFDRYKGGLDTVHDLTGLHSVFTHWRGIEIMFHVSTMLPHEPNDPQKVDSKNSLIYII